MIRVTAQRRLLGLVCVLLTSSSVCDAESPRERVEAAIVDFVEGRSKLPKLLICSVEGISVDGKGKKETSPVAVKHLWYLDSTHTGGVEFFASGISKAPDSEKFLWEQTLNEKRTSLRRYGFGNKRDQQFDLAEMKKSGQVKRPSLPNVDLFNLPVATLGDYLSSRVAPEYMEKYFVLNGELREAEDLGSGLYRGWFVVSGKPGAVVNITFSDAENMMPVEAEWRMKKDADQSYRQAKTKQRVNTVIKSTYRRYLIDGDAIYLPKVVRLNDYGLGDGEGWTSSELNYQWFFNVINRPNFTKSPDDIWVHSVSRIVRSLDASK